MKRWKIFFLMLLPFFLISADDIRPFLNTGPWYPSDPARLDQMLDQLFKGVPAAETVGTVRGIIAPHAGFEYSGRCAASAYRYLTPAADIRRVILLGASHRSGFYGACVCDYAAYATPLGTVPVDTEICRALAAKKFFKSDRDTMRFEHSLENQLPFLQKALGASAFKIVPVIFGALDKKAVATMAGVLAPYVDEKTLVVASSDLTHFGDNFSYTPFRRDLANNLTRLDRGFTETIQKLDFDAYWRYREKTGITACGYVPIGVLIRLFAAEKCRVLLSDYYKSGDLTGDYANSVSYASLVLSSNAGSAGDPIGLDPAEQKLLLNLARKTLQAYFQNERTPPAQENEFSSFPRLQQSLGVFVTLKEKGDLRGCIGSIVGREPLFRGVISNAIHAAVDDPRFPLLRHKELANVEIEISVMTPLRPLTDYRSIRLGTDGVVIRDGNAQAVFLPQVASETGWTLEQFLGNLCLKAGLERDAFRRSRGMQFYVFQAQVFGEKERPR